MQYHGGNVVEISTNPTTHNSVPKLDSDSTRDWIVET